MQRLVAFAWPGNVRQLRNAIETAVLVTPGPTIEVASLPPDVVAATHTASADPRAAFAPLVEATIAEPGPASLSQPLMMGAAGAGTGTPEERLAGLVMPVEDAEKILIRNALRAFDGNREQAAGALGISERTLYRKIRQWGAQVTN